MEITNHIDTIQHKIVSFLDKQDNVVFENPTNIGKQKIVEHLVTRYGKVLYVSPSYDVSRQWNDRPDIIPHMVFVTYRQLAGLDIREIDDFIAPYNLVILDEVHHAGADRYLPCITAIMASESVKVFGMTTHTKRYSDDAQDVADTIFGGHKINGISFEDAIRQNLLPQFDYISALYSLPRDIDELVASSSIAKKIVSDSGLLQVNEDGIKNIIKKHMPEGHRKVVYFTPTVEDSEDAEKIAKDLGYGKVYVVNYTKTEKENRAALKAYNSADTASLICISKFNEGAIPEGTNTVVMLRRTVTISIFERQILTALQSADKKAVVYDFVSNIDNLIYSQKSDKGQFQKHYAERVKSLCSQSIVIDYTKQWMTVFGKLRALNKNGWTEAQDNRLKELFPKYGREIYRYIKDHSFKECLVRAEILGLEYNPVKEVSEKPQTKQDVKKPYSFEFEEYDPVINELLPAGVIKQFCEIYLYTLDFGRIPDKALDIKDQRQLGALMLLSDECIKATLIIDNSCEKMIRNRQDIFRSYLNSYASSFGKKAEKMVIIGGKVFQGDEAMSAMKRAQKEQSFQKKLEQGKLILVDGEYRGTNHLIAGLYGSTPSEHVLYKTYRHLLLDTLKNKASVVSYLIKELTDDDVKEKINNLRSRRNPWSELDMLKIKEFSKKNNTYGSLLRTHSDLDILEKVTEIGKVDLIKYSTARSNFFENSFNAFMKNYKKALEKRRLYEAERLKQQQAEEENRKRNEERKKQMKNFKPTIVVVSKKK